MCMCVLASRPGHMTAAAPSLPSSKPAPLLLVGERLHWVAFLSVWERTSLTQSSGGRERGGMSKAENPRGQNCDRGGQVKMSVGCVCVCMWACVCVWWNERVNRKPLWLLPCFINTAVCLVWTAPWDRHKDRKTDRQTHLCHFFFVSASVLKRL